MNSKEQQLYEFVFESIIKIINSFGIADINIETVVTDQETALINVVNKYFPKAHVFHVIFIINQILLKISKNMDYGEKIKKNK